MLSLDEEWHFNMKPSTVAGWNIGRCFRKPWVGSIWRDHCAYLDAVDRLTTCGLMDIVDVTQKATLKHLTVHWRFQRCALRENPPLHWCNIILRTSVTVTAPKSTMGGSTYIQTGLIRTKSRALPPTGGSTSPQSAADGQIRQHDKPIHLTVSGVTVALRRHRLETMHRIRLLSSRASGELLNIWTRLGRSQQIKSPVSHRWNAVVRSSLQYKWRRPRRYQNVSVADQTRSWGLNQTRLTFSVVLRPRPEDDSYDRF